MGKLLKGLLLLLQRVVEGDKAFEVVVDSFLPHSIEAGEPVVHEPPFSLSRVHLRLCVQMYRKWVQRGSGVENYETECTEVQPVKVGLFSVQNPHVDSGNEIPQKQLCLPFAPQPQDLLLSQSQLHRILRMFLNPLMAHRPSGLPLRRSVSRSLSSRHKMR